MKRVNSQYDENLVTIIPHSADEKIIENKIEQQYSKQKLFYRLFFCCIAIGLLWITTLDLAITIVQSSIPSPVLNSVVNSCHTAYTYVQIERKNYEKCGEIQTQQCDSDLSNLYQREYDRSQQVLQSNQILQQKVQFHHSLCEGNLQDTIASLSAWGNQITSSSSSSAHQTPNMIFYPSCSISDRSKVANLLGISLTSNDNNENPETPTDQTTPTPREIKQTNLYNALKFTKSTSLLLQSVVTYSKDFSSYNQDYLMNHTQVTSPQLTSSLVTQISAPYLQYLLGNHNLPTGASLDLSKTLKSNLESFTACMSLNPALAKNCSLMSATTSVLLEYNKIQTLVNRNIQQMKIQTARADQMVQEYGTMVKNSIETADKYFDAVRCKESNLLIFFLPFLIFHLLLLLFILLPSSLIDLTSSQQRWNGLIEILFLSQLL
jgi:hypothetical protein